MTEEQGRAVLSLLRQIATATNLIAISGLGVLIIAAAQYGKTLDGWDKLWSGISIAAVLFIISKSLESVK